jgi:hypothetical protein
MPDVAVADATAEPLVCELLSVMMLSDASSERIREFQKQ